MVRLVLALIRFCAVHLAFLLSSFSAAAFLTFTLFLGRDLGWLTHDPLAGFGAFGFCLAIWLTIIQWTYMPFLIIMILLELTRQSSLIVNLLAGGLCSLAILIFMPEISASLYQENTIPALPYEPRNIFLSILASGFIGGFAYWLLAGHRAGRWLGPIKTIWPQAENNPHDQ